MSQIYCSTVGCRRTAHGLRGEYGKPLCAVCHRVYEQQVNDQQGCQMYRKAVHLLTEAGISPKGITKS